MTWEQLRELQGSGLFNIQSHTYWHPNFKHEKKRLTPEQYEKLVDLQLTKSKDILERQLGVHVDMLAWPFGIYDDELIKKVLPVVDEAGKLVGILTETDLLKALVFLLRKMSSL